MKNERFHTDEFVMGFIIGWQLAKGIKADVPEPPTAPDSLPPNSTLYLEGITRGLSAAGMYLRPDFDLNPNPMQANY